MPAITFDVNNRIQAGAAAEELLAGYYLPTVTELADVLFEALDDPAAEAWKDKARAMLARLPESAARTIPGA